MIYCCGGYHKAFRTVFISPDFQYRDRKLEIAVCPVCKALVAVLTQFNIKEQKYEVFRPKRKKTAKFIQDLQQGKWKEMKVKYGTKERSGFIFGLNKELKNGLIYQYAVNFNGVKKLVKIVEKTSNYG